MYVHVSAAGLLLAGGYWDMSSAQVDRLRRGIADDVAGPALTRAITGITRKGFDIGGQQLTRVPSGYEKDHPRADLLRYKTLTARREYGSPAWLTTARARSEIVKASKIIAPLIAWLDTHVGRG
jgi:uncharacterized protein (DUF2461 family)